MPTIVRPHFEEQQRGIAVIRYCAETLLVIDVDSLILPSFKGQFVQSGALFARTTPFRPKIHQHEQRLQLPRQKFASVKVTIFAPPYKLLFA
jgi:hypothetical protein